ncbi:MAG: phytoene desaturase, partial [Mangrovimonas sp.]|nr:phytoene desaturase [Mangrovimonas sp.]
TISDKRLQSILEFPVLFLGAKPSNTPAFYNFMNHADFGLGTWHPKGGMYKVIEGIVSLAQSLGVELRTNSDVGEIITSNGNVSGLVVNGQQESFDLVVSGADYAHTEKLLPEAYRQYSKSYWEKKTFAPSALLFYVGFNKPVENVSHHTLFFDTDFNVHAKDIYDTPRWPENPLFYASFPSKTDTSVAPSGKEAGVFLIPLAPGLEDDENLREHYFDLILDRLEKLTNQELRSKILFKESFGIQDFIKEYNSYKGNAYGLANTLMQTAFLRPKLKSKKLKGMYFTGQLTVPGPGVPPSLISGKLTAELIQKYELKN